MAVYVGAFHRTPWHWQLPPALLTHPNLLNTLSSLCTLCLTKRGGIKRRGVRLGARGSPKSEQYFDSLKIEWSRAQLTLETRVQDP